MWDVEGTVFQVVVNNERQYSIWPTSKTLPSGWILEGFQGEKQACLEHIDKVWIDMRPTNLRQFQN